MSFKTLPCMGWSATILSKRPLPPPTKEATTADAGAILPGVLPKPTARYCALLASGSPVMDAAIVISVPVRVHPS